MTQGSDLLANMIANDKGFFDISKICVSNSIYGSNSEFVSMGNLEQLSLNMNSMQGLGNRFLEEKSGQTIVLWVNILKFRILWQMKKK